jgi:hypothetical protein
MLSVCLCTPTINVSKPKPIFKKFVMHIMAIEWLSVLHKSIQLVCLYVIEQGETPYRKYKRLKLGGGHLYDRSSVLDFHGSVYYYQ